MSLSPIGRSKIIRWFVSSQSDKRWNNSGECRGFITMTPYEVIKWLDNCENKYGKKPSDLNYEAYKY